MNDLPLLRRALDEWAESGLVARFWWRDDDATARTPALERLLAIAGEYDAPLCLAVIPAAAEMDLEICLGNDAPRLTLAQHGYAHVNHAPAGEKKSEYPGYRNAEHVVTELRRGRARLQGFCGVGPAFFVPPWNRIDPVHAPALRAAGFAALSRFTDRGTGFKGFVTLDAHIDPVAWRLGGGLVAEDIWLAMLRTALENRRKGRVETAKPIGLLSHHLVHDETLWSFIEGFVRTVTDHPAARWIDAGEYVTMREVL